MTAKLLWINGAFGSGKTQTAFELHRRIPDSFVFDPENAGYYIRKNMPAALAVDDFQDYPMWRDFNYAMLRHIGERYEGTVIIPMTVVNPQYFEELAGRLRSEGLDVFAITLWVSREELVRRLRRRGERNDSWPVYQIERCLQGLADDVFRPHLDTTSMPIEAVAEAIAAQAGIALLPDRAGKLGRKIARLKTQLKHVRFFS